MGFDLSHGGHLTQDRPSIFRANTFNLVLRSGRINRAFNYDEIQKRAEHERPDLIICGASAYSRDIDYVRRAIADSVGALLMADISHPRGIAKVLNDPLPHAMWSQPRPTRP